MRVLLSIKPEFALRIFKGCKKYEYRRVIFRREGVKRVLVYASAPIGKVIGEFEVAHILHDRPRQLWMKTKQHAGLSKKRFFEYFANASAGYAIKVRSCALYDNPLALTSLMITSPPQSFRYLP